MALESVFFFLLVLLIDYRAFTRVSNALLRFTGSAIPSGRADQHEDEDVARERARVETLLVGPDSEDVLVLRGLSKVYATGSLGCGQAKLAVDRVSVGVPRAECFGLLGVNGAGKTTTFGMLTGDLTVSSGNAYVEGWSILTNMRQASIEMGKKKRKRKRKRKGAWQIFLKRFAKISPCSPLRSGSSLDTARSA